jgi:hypothetical protein
MPEQVWRTFFSRDCILDHLVCQQLTGDVIEFGSGYRLFTVSAAK